MNNNKLPLSDIEPRTVGGNVIWIKKESPRELFARKRRERGTLRQFAAAFGYTPSYWSEVETGKRKMPKNQKLMKKIAKFFDIDECVFKGAADDART